MKDFEKLILKPHANSEICAISVRAPESHAISVSLAWEKIFLWAQGINSP